MNAKKLVHLACDTLWRARASGEVACVVCQGPTRVQSGHGRLFRVCSKCGIAFTRDYPEALARLGMGMTGSWGGVDVGGEREDFLVRLCYRRFQKRSFLLFGVGSTLGFRVLADEGFDVYGCDVSRDVIRLRQKQYGAARFFHTDTLPKQQSRYDVIVACEVIEHLTRPRRQLALLQRALAPGGIICGTTDIFPGGDIDACDDVGYMALRGHVTYWTEQALAHVFAEWGLQLVLFEMIRPGSVLPDSKRQQLYPNKRVFFLTADTEALAEFRKLRDQNPVLPLDTEDYLSVYTDAREGAGGVR